MTDNERITKWLGRCWHEFAERPDEYFKSGTVPTCIHCEAVTYEPLRDANEGHDFTTPSGFFDLLAGLTERGYEVFMNNETGEFAVEIYPLEWPNNPETTGDILGDTLPEALIAATLKLLAATPQAETETV